MKWAVATFFAVAILTGVFLCWYGDWGHAPVEKMAWLHGQSIEAVLTALGEPTRRLEYTMANSPGGEFRVELLNTYPPGDRKPGRRESRNCSGTGNGI
jgi:hypothetical protein